MEVFLGNMVASFTGSINRKHGYPKPNIFRSIAATI